jgi:hypothetical protein
MKSSVLNTYFFPSTISCIACIPLLKMILYLPLDRLSEDDDDETERESGEA